MIYVGTIHLTHASVVKMMIDAGKHVLCEKPLTMNACDTVNLIQSARSKNIFLMEVSK